MNFFQTRNLLFERLTAGIAEATEYRVSFGRKEMKDLKLKMKNYLLAIFHL
jgi:hypothetical protein